MGYKKVLKDLDKGHSFYSDEAIRSWKRRMKELAREEKELAKKRSQPIESIHETNS